MGTKSKFQSIMKVAVVTSVLLAAVLIVTFSAVALNLYKPSSEGAYVAKGAHASSSSSSSSRSSPSSESSSTRDWHDDDDDDRSLYQRRQDRSAVQRQVLQTLYDNVVWPHGTNLVYEALTNNNFSVPETIFSEDVVVSLPPVGRFEGILGNLEYFYGLSGPVQNGLPNPRRVVETPFTFANCWNNSCSFQVLINFHDFENESIVTSFKHHGTIFFNSDNKICGGQINFVNQAYRDIDPTDPVALARHRATLCNVVQAQCTGVNQQYDSVEACLEYVSHLPYGGFYSNDQNTTSCRVLHLSLQRISPLSAERHCPHSGPDGGEKCVPHGADFYLSDDVVQYSACRDPNF